MSLTVPRLPWGPSERWVGAGTKEDMWAGPDTHGFFPPQRAGDLEDVLDRVAQEQA